MLQSNTKNLPIRTGFPFSVAVNRQYHRPLFISSRCSKAPVLGQGTGAEIGSALLPEDCGKGDPPGTHSNTNHRSDRNARHSPSPRVGCCYAGIADIPPYFGKSREAFFCLKSLRKARNFPQIPLKASFTIFFRRGRSG